RQHQHRRLTVLYEVARHREHEVRVVAEHLRQELVGHGRRDVGAPFYEFRSPPGGLTLVQRVRQLWPESDRLRRNSRDDAIGRALDEIPDKGSRDAEAEDHELVDPQVIHQTDVVVGVRIPRTIDLERAGRLTGRVAQVSVNTAELVLERLDSAKRI